MSCPAGNRYPTINTSPTMIRHWTTMAALVEELRPQLVDAFVDECFLTDHGELGVHIEHSNGSLILTFAPFPPISGIYVQRAKPPHTRRRLFPMITEAPIEGITISDADRIVTITVGQWEILIVAIPGARANCIVRERDSNLFVTALRQQPGMEAGMPWEPPLSPLPEPLSCPATMSVGEVLEQSRLLLAAPYAERFCHDHKLDPSCLWGTISEDEQVRIVHAALDYRRRLICAPTPVIARHGETELFLLEPPLEPDWTVEPVSSVEEGLQRRVRTLYRMWALDTARRALHHRIQTELQRIERAMQHLSEDIAHAPKAEQFEQWGQLLVTHPQRHQRGLDAITAIGWDGAEHQIPLDSALTVLDNAERYFARARKVRRAAEFARSRMQSLAERRHVLQSGSEILSSCPTLERVRALEQTLYPPTAQPIVRQSLSGRKARVRQFPLAEGYLLLVGKDAQSNDELTFRIAKPHDIWLHARGVEGAHGLIPLSTRTLPPPPIIEQAAAIVAYYSGARHAHYVPVSWTQRKYLRRSKKGGAGAVDLLREWVVFVEPRQPFDTSETES